MHLLYKSLHQGLFPVDSVCNAAARENKVCNFSSGIFGLIFIHMNYSKL